MILVNVKYWRSRVAQHETSLRNLESAGLILRFTPSKEWQGERMVEIKVVITLQKALFGRTPNHYFGI